MINYGRHFIDEKDIDSVVKVLRSGFLTTGPKVEEFEKIFASYVGAKYAVAVSNGTAGLHIACLAAGLSRGDKIITSPMTFVASANCALYCGAKPVFADINELGLVDESKIEKQVTPKTRIIIPVHYAGLPCDMGKIKEIADKHNLAVIEDACHALGAEYKNSRIGDCCYSDMAVFSFHPVKHITTGEGGMVTTNSKEMYKKLLLLRSHGITKDPSEFVGNNDGLWYYEMQEMGFNYRITDFQCALGISQFSKLEAFLEKRRAIAKRYDQFVKDNKQHFEYHAIPKDRKSAHHLYVLQLKDKNKRNYFFNGLKAAGILPQVHYIPVHLQPYYKSNFNYNKGDFPEAEHFYEKIISLPIYYGLTDDELDRVISTLSQLASRGC